MSVVYSGDTETFKKFYKLVTNEKYLTTENFYKTLLLIAISKPEMFEVIEKS